MKSVSLLTAAGLVAFLMTGCGDEPKKDKTNSGPIIKRTEEESQKNQESQRAKQEGKSDEKPKVEDKSKTEVKPKPDDKPKVDAKPK